MRLKDCLKKMGLSKHEKAIMNALTRENQVGGRSEIEAAKLAVAQRLKELTAQRASVMRQIAEYQQNPEARSGPPVAESQALPPEGSDAGVAPGQVAALPDVQPEAFAHPYPPAGDDTDPVRVTARALRTGDAGAVSRAAADMAKLIPEGATLIPIPGAGGGVGPNLALATVIAKVRGGTVADILTGPARARQYEAKKAGNPLTPEQIGTTLKPGVEIPANGILIDNVIGTGATLAAARRAIGSSMPIVAYAKEVPRGTIDGKPADGFTLKELTRLTTRGRNKAVRLEAEAELERRADEKASKPLSEKQLAARKRLSERGRALKVIDQNKDSLLEAIAKNGGINMAERDQIMGDKSGNLHVPFVGWVFSKTGGMGVDDMATSLAQDFYMSPQEMEDGDGGVSALMAKIREDMDLALENKPQTHFSATRDALSMEQEMRARQEAEEDAALAAEMEQQAGDAAPALELDVTPEDLAVEGLPATVANLVTVDLLTAAKERIGEAAVERLAMQAESDSEFEASVLQFDEEQRNANQRANEEVAQGVEAGAGPAQGEAVGQPAGDLGNAPEGAVKPKKSKEDFEAHLAALKAKEQARIDAIGEVKDFAIMRDERSTDHWWAVLPDVSGGAAWRIQFFDLNGFSGHEVYNSKDEAIRAAASSGYYTRDDGALDRIQNTPGFQRGLAAADIIRRANGKEIGWEQAHAEIAALGDAVQSKRATLEQQRPPYGDQTKIEAFKRWSNNAPLIGSAAADAHNFKTGERVVVEAFHGTQRPDRVGSVFKKSRATSGPMAFHTSDPALASSYATGKSDTSLNNEDTNYETWFRVKIPGLRNAVSLDRAWYHLSAEDRAKIADLAPRVGAEYETGDKPILHDEGTTTGLGGYDQHLKEARGNHLKALVEEWLSSGALFNDEIEFMKVLKLAGVDTSKVEMHDPGAAFPFVFKNYIAMQNPLVTTDIPQSVTDALNAAAKRDRTREQQGGDAWDKARRTLRSWVEEYNRPADNAYVWTSIPDKVTELLKSLGYDGIIDRSGKGGGPIHPVYIPFHETQIKSAIGNKGTYGDTGNILKQPVPAYGQQGFDLVGETEAQIRAREAEAKAQEKAGMNTAQKAEAALRAVREKKEIAARSKTDEFALQPTQAVDRKRQAEIDRKAAEDSLAGQSNLFQERAAYYAAQPTPWYYSELARSIEASPMKQGTAKAWQDYIKSRVGKGVKPEEIEATGINDWLATQEGKVTKEQVQTFMEQGGVKVTETVLSGERMRDLENKLRGLLDQRAKFISDYADSAARMGGDREAVADALRQIIVEPFDQEAWKVVSEYQTAHLDPNAMHDFSDDLVDARQAIEDANDGREDNTKFATYQLPGSVPGSYRELVLTLPPQEGVYGELPKGYRVVTNIDGARVERVNDGTVVARGWNSDAAVDAALKKLGEKPTFRSTHFSDAGNYLAHTRVNDRILPDGRKVLFVEEIQSDRAQKGRAEGFIAPKQPSPGLPSGFEIQQTEHQYLVKDPVSGFKVDIGKGTVGSEKEAREYANRYFWTKAGEADQRNLGKIAPAPFVTKTDSWTALVLKRLLRYAAEGEYDAISWTTGRQQFERWGSEEIAWVREYGLRDHVNGAGWRVSGKEQRGGQAGGIDIEGEARARGILKEEKGQTVRSKEQLREVVARVLSRENNAQAIDKVTNRVWDRMQTEDAGTSLPRKEGMEEYYDKIAPKVAAEVAKKVGGGKVMEIAIPDRARDLIAAQIYGRGETYESLPEIPRAVVDKNLSETATKQQALEITPAMREKIMAGQALFQKKPDYNEPTAEKVYDSTPVREGTNAKQRSAGIAALERFRVLWLHIGETALQRGSPRVLGSAIWKDFQERGGSELLGKQAGSAEELALAAQILRDPRWETMRAVFVKGSTIVGHTAWTVRKAGSVAFAVEGNYRDHMPAESVYLRIAQLKKEMRQHKADGYYLIHNHPNGYSTPSPNDEVITRMVAADMRGFLGHVVIDHDEYSVINRAGKSERFRLAATARAAPEIAHDLLGVPIGSPQALVNAARMLTDGRKGYAVLISTNAMGEIQALAEVPEELLVGGKDPIARGRAIVRIDQFMEGTGSAGGAFIVADNPSRFDWLINKGHLTDAVDAGGGLSRRSFIRAPKADQVPRRSPKNVLAAHQMQFPGYQAAVAAPTHIESMPKWAESLPEAQKEALRKAGVITQEKTLVARIKEMGQEFSKSFKQGLFDQFAPIKELDYRAYMLARMSRGSDGGLEAMMMYGKPYLDGGALNVRMENGGLMKVFQSLQGEHDRFLAWIAGNRAAQLKAEGRENLFTDDDISALKDLNQGQMPDGTSRLALYTKTHEQFNGYMNAILDIAEQTGLIDGESRAVWAKDFYVPFYRVMEDGAGGPSIKSGLVNQYAFKKLKGGREGLHDLMSNTLMNWSHLLSASLKNQAADAALQAAEGIGAAQVIPGQEKGAVSVLRSGDKVWYDVSEPMLLDAITAMEWAGFKGPAMAALGKFKRALTTGVTVNPTFKVRNLIRDTVSSIAQGDLSYNAAKNMAQGWRLTAHNNPVRASMMAGGGLMRFGTMLEGNTSVHAKRLIEAGVDANTILDKPHKVVAMLQKAWDAYQETGDRGEQVNRAALYQQLRDRGFSHLEASYQARDLLDFSMQGKWTAVRFLTQVVPFMNARLQGMYKLGRAAAEDPQRMAYVIGGLSLASMALLLWNAGDDDWKKREDWDRDQYWWFKIGDTAYRIPKPFEVGAVASVAERSLEYLISEERDPGKRFMKSMGNLVSNNLSMNPIPQIVKPLIDLYANQDSFTGRQIETEGMRNLSKDQRIGRGTSLPAQILGKLDPTDTFSPVQVDFMARAYFGWLGTAALTTLDYGLRPFSGLPGKPEAKLRDFPVIGNFTEGLPANQSRYVTLFYDEAKTIHEAYADWHNALVMGDKEKAAEMFKNRGELIVQERLAAAGQRALGGLNRQERMIEINPGLTPQTKRILIDAIAAQKDKIAKQLTLRQQAK